ncbi:MAG: type IV secretion system protein, partial [Janthinobacterium lividum]
SFLIGSLNLTHTELIARVIKIGIISALLSSKYSWDFFNDYLFAYFIGGVSQILQMINQAGQASSGSSSIIALMIAPQTIAKLFSLLFVDWLGFVYIILFLVALYFLFMMIFEATIIYLTALIAIGIIITMAPIFLCFMLFQITRSLFENWLRQLISYAIQPIILFTGIAFISIIVEGEIYASLGFKVCKHDFPNLGPTVELFGDVAELTSAALGLDISLVNSIFYSWFPVPMKGEDFTKNTAIIPVPESFIQSDGTLCEAYGCLEERYVELPYLNLVEDADRINNFFNGNFIQLDGLLLIFAAVYLLSKFNTTSVSVANFLASTTGNMTSLGNAGHSAFAPIARQIDRPITAVKERLGKGRNIITSKISRAYENVMNKNVRNNAIGKETDSAALKEVKKNYSLDQKDIKAAAISADEKISLQDSALKAKISREPAKARDDVLEPEYLARLEKGGNIAEVGRLKELDEMKLNSDIGKALTDKDDPVPTRETLMGTKAADSQLNRESAKARDDVLEPEYLARLEKEGNIAEAGRLKELDRMKLRSDVLRALTDKDDPVLMGETFMSTKATDSQLKNMIDRAYETGEKFLQQDRYLRREEEYQVIQEKSLEDIKSKYDFLSTYYGRKDIKSEEMMSLLTDYYSKSPTTDPRKAEYETTKLTKSLIDFDFSKTILEKLDERKAEINKEIEAAVEKINKKRIEARMSEYRKRKDQQLENSDKISEQRKLRSINDYLK